MDVSPLQKRNRNMTAGTVPVRAEPSDRARAAAPLLSVNGLRTSVLKPSSFSLSPGECIVVQGPSGSGKTLLLRAIADLDPNEGQVCLGGQERAQMSGPEWRRLVGYLPAEPGWWADAVGDHFADWTAALPVAKALGFSADPKDWPVARLSTGERLRLALVRTLLVEPKVLLLDEPTAALDPGSVRAVESLIAGRVKAGLSVIWVTHDEEQARRMAKRRLFVSGGAVQVEEGACPATLP
jgi:putative ABC transport system ATP-binding protein